MQGQAPDPSGSLNREVNSEESSSQLLSQLLEETLAQKQRSLSEHEWNSLQEIVKKFEDSPTAFEDLVEALVEAFLRSRLSSTVVEVGSMNRMSRSIAKTLCSDPTSRQRLMEFQKQLRGLL